MEIEGPRKRYAFWQPSGLKFRTRIPEPSLTCCGGAKIWIRAVDILMRVDDEVYDFLEGLLLRPWVTDENTPERPSEEMLKDYIASVLMDISPSQRLRHSLLTVLERYKLLGAARALARKKDPEATPYLLEMLEDDTKRRGAGGALLHYDERVLPYLVTKKR